ncbi:MAG: hypothetical protein Q4B91_07530 [Atopobiaceae bacterium]|nr:hypothetical protein [Atopobiaceae bacterium]
MGARRQAPELVFRGRVAPWYQALTGVVTLAAAVLALQPGMPLGVPILVFVVGAVLLLPAALRNRVELYADHLEVLFGWNHVVIPYTHVRGVVPRTWAASQFTGHNCASSTDGLFIEAPEDGDAAVCVTDNDALAAELRRRAGLDAARVEKN